MLIKLDKSKNNEQHHRQSTPFEAGKGNQDKNIVRDKSAKIIQKRLRTSINGTISNSVI